MEATGLRNVCREQLHEARPLWPVDIKDHRDRGSTKHGPVLLHPLFERMLEELGCPSVDGLAAWWPEDFYTAGELGRVLSELFADGGHEDEIGAAASVLGQALAAHENDVAELIGSAMEWFHDKVVETEPSGWAEAEGLLPPSLRGWFQ